MLQLRVEFYSNIPEKNTLEDEAELDDLNRLDELEDELDETTETI